MAKSEIGSPFISAANAVLQRLGFVGIRDVRALEAAYQRFVESCVAGFPLSIYDYENDLSYRDCIRLILDNDGLLTLEGAGSFVAHVADLDSQFQSLLVPLTLASDPGAWWRRGIPRYAGDELREDIFSEYGLKISSLLKPD